MSVGKSEKTTCLKCSYTKKRVYLCDECFERMRENLRSKGIENKCNYEKAD